MATWAFWHACWNWLRTQRLGCNSRQQRPIGGRLGFDRLEDRRLLTVALQFATPTISEQAATVLLAATLPAPATSNVDIGLDWSGKAKRGQDYQAADSRIRIAAGSVSGSITLTTIDDALSEPSELIEVRANSITGTTELWDGQPAYARIVDNDTPLAVTGTSGNDLLSIWLYNTNFVYRLNNGPVTTVAYTAYRSVRFLDASQSDLDTLVLVTPRAGGSQVNLARTGIVLEGNNPFEVISSNIERQYVNGMATDEATLQGTANKDNYWGLPSYSVTTSGKMLMQVTGIRNVTMNSNGGADVALLYSNGRTSIDSYRAGTASATMTKTGGTSGDATQAFRNTAVGFRYVYGYADDTNDVATFDDSPNLNDTFLAQSALAYMLASTNTTYQNNAYYYANVVANSTGGNDSAYLYDSPQVDTFRGNNAVSRMEYGSGTIVTAHDFRDVYAISNWNSVLDRVFLTDSFIDDIDATSNNPFERSRNDHLQVYVISADMNYGNRRVVATGFEQLNAASTEGGTDTVVVFGNSFVNPVITGFVNEQTLSTSRREALQAARAYLRDTQKFDIRRYTSRGTDYLNPEFADIVGRLALEWSQQFPTRPAFTAQNVNDVAVERIYDFSRLEEVENSLLKVDRQSVLQRLFDEITRNAKNNVERQTAIIEFGHKSLQHNTYIQPLSYDQKIRNQTGQFVADGAAAQDPLVLLELAEGRCGHVNKLIADIWHSLGFRVRLVIVNSHTSGELMYEGQWHYNDAGLFGGREIPVVPIAPGSTELKVPSFEELATRPELVDRMALYVGVFRGNMLPYAVSTQYASYWYFEDLKAGYYSTYEKNAAADLRAQGSRDYGWLTLDRGEINWIKQITTEPGNTQPSAPQINQVVINGTGFGATATIGWTAAFDNLRLRVDANGRPVLSNDGSLIYDWYSTTPPYRLNSDVVGYYVSVSTTSRGWNYNTYNGFESVAPNVRSFKANDEPWSPSMYDARYKSTPRDVMTLWVPATATQLNANEVATVKLPGSGTYYLTVMAIDAKGQAIGKQNYLQSEEIKITV